MGKMTKVSVLFLLASVLLFGSTATAQTKGVPDYQIVSIKAMVFNQETGVMTPIGDKDVLFNTFGDLVIVVQYKGQANTLSKGRKVNLAISNGKKSLFSQVASADGTGIDGVSYRMFFYRADLLCEDITIKATLKGQSRDSSLALKLPFSCGE